ncbi:DNA-binding transcriptional LysR family regulator [Povalibacter uvarum]|uniref:DNA-binding transcriptional LysR family regulator n=1 Tax=Povalibacter uvarum TaxID=732238 RepID=A0A841HRT9_9GAMM|nr:LysR family transcriptional regulator [Povalibacter uvarum]MBB6095364.1 DNA-binding transcriptional LysR family regulator [Povalibacter uvarum]
MNRLDAMQIFVRVAELTSFTRAADALNLPKASVSTAIQQLEAEMGTRLLHRTTRKVQLTQDGRAFYERCKDLLADMDELRAMFQGSEALRGRLRIDMPNGFAKHLLIPRLPEFLREHPQLEIELSVTDRKVDLIREGFDCVLRVGAIEDQSLIARPLGQFRIINCVSPAYIAQHGLPRSVDDLRSHQLIHYVGTLGSKSAGFEYFDGSSYRNVEMPGAITVNSVEAYEAGCVAGLGIIQAPAVGMERLLAEGTIVEVLPELRAEPMPVSLVYAHRRNLSRRVQTFMAWIARTLQPHLDPLSS